MEQLCCRRKNFLKEYLTIDNLKTHIIIIEEKAVPWRKRRIFLWRNSGTEAKLLCSEEDVLNEGDYSTDKAQHMYTDNSITFLK